ncbi:hypothetical protein F442_12647 [Phytophthora nicotianae P10297]|uniref:Uncharacterized protein n=1 Tax=Phytophthora nicotianae P10297 TaxID=1317064 RepID=W2Z137_PHYNI|nr:hypothetical protein F442_12647 [Phytophthora nicotianae P10297]
MAKDGRDVFRRFDWSDRNTLAIVRRSSFNQ